MTAIAKRGAELIQDPSLNKSTAVTEAERRSLGVIGLVPDVTETEDLRLRRVLTQLGHKNTGLDRYIYLVNLLDHDETLFSLKRCPQLRQCQGRWELTLGYGTSRTRRGSGKSCTCQKPLRSQCAVSLLRRDQGNKLNHRYCP